MRHKLWFLGILSLLSVGSVMAETLVTEAKILEVTSRGYVLKVGTEPLAVEDSAETRAWRSYSRTGREGFKKDDTVGVRIKTDSDPPIVREIADVATWRWLNSLRKEPLKAVVEKVESKSMKVKFEDGKAFDFRISEKTNITIGGKECGLSDLTPGLTVYVKGRLLPTLDTWLEAVSDRPLATKASASKPDAKAKPLPPLPDRGSFTGIVEALLTDLRMFDVTTSDGRKLHVTYGVQTAIQFENEPAKPDRLTKGMRCVVHYKRDKAGRILASKVDLFPPKGG